MRQQGAVAAGGSTRETWCLNDIEEEIAAHGLIAFDKPLLQLSGEALFFRSGANSRNRLLPSRQQANNDPRRKSSSSYRIRLEVRNRR
jgi:hypothetical protein